MIIDKASLKYIENVVKTAQLVKIGNIIIEPDRVRAIDEENTVILFQEKDVPIMPFGSIGLNRIDTFTNRMSVAQSIDNFELEAVVEEGDPKNVFARALTMKAKGIKLDYRCANPATIRAPKTINDTIKYSVEMNPAAVLLMQKGQSAMGSDEITFVGNDDGVSFEVTDVNSDKMEYKFADSVQKEVEGDRAPAKFMHKYPIKTITTLFKEVSTARFYLTTKGILRVTVHNLDMYVLPRT